MEYALPNMFTLISLNLKFTITVLIKGKKNPSPVRKKWFVEVFYQKTQKYCIYWFTP